MTYVLEIEDGVQLFARNVMILTNKDVLMPMTATDLFLKGIVEIFIRSSSEMP